MLTYSFVVVWRVSWPLLTIEFNGRAAAPISKLVRPHMSILTFYVSCFLSTIFLQKSKLGKNSIHNAIELNSRKITGRYKDAHADTN